MNTRKIDAMHMHFGVCEGKQCADCLFLVTKTYDRRYYKCEIYGDSNSVATDWAKRWDACGLIDDPDGSIPFQMQWGTMTNYIRHNRPKQAEEPVEGQISMEELMNESV